jgi:hypothetical protein
VSARTAAAFALAAALLVGAGCDDADTPRDAELVTVDVDATIAVEDTPAGIRVTGEVVLDLEAPAGGEGTDLVLMALDVGPYTLGASEVRGLDTFPDHLDAGEKARVVLGVELGPVASDTQGSVRGCGDASAGWDVRVSVLDARAAEASEWATGYATAVAQVVPETPDPGPPLLLATTIWRGPAGSVLAVDPEGGDDVLVVRPGGRVERVTPAGEVTVSGETAITPLVVARGGGVDVVVGWPVDPGDTRCGPMEGGVVLARVEDGELAWCTRLRDPGVPAVAVARSGVISVLEAGATDAFELRRIDPDGATLSTTRLEKPLFQLMAAPDGRLVALSFDVDELPIVIVVDGDDVRSIPLGTYDLALGLRPDGAIAARHDYTWVEIDLDALELIPVADFDPTVGLPSGAGAELEDGSLVALTSGYFTDPTTTYGTGTALEVSLHQASTVAWREAIACTAFQAWFLPTIGPLRYGFTTSVDSGTAALLRIERAP